MRLLLLSILLFGSALASAHGSHAKGRPAPMPAAGKSCANWMTGFNKYEDLTDDGKIVWRYNTVRVRQWDPNEQFTGILLLKELVNPVLQVEFTSSLGEKKSDKFDLVLPFELNGKVKVFENFKPGEFFTFEDEGTFVLRLKSGDNEICSIAGRYRGGH
jgi:hypothetical protein